MHICFSFFKKMVAEGEESVLYKIFEKNLNILMEMQHGNVQLLKSNDHAIIICRTKALNKRIQGSSVYREALMIIYAKQMLLQKGGKESHGLFEMQ